MNAYTKEQIRQALLDLFAKDNARLIKPRNAPTSQQYVVLGMVTIALQDYDKKQTTPAGDMATPQ